MPNQSFEHPPPYRRAIASFIGEPPVREWAHGAARLGLHCAQAEQTCESFSQWCAGSLRRMDDLAGADRIDCSSAGDPGEVELSGLLESEVPTGENADFTGIGVLLLLQVAGHDPVICVKLGGPLRPHQLTITFHAEAAEAPALWRAIEDVEPLRTWIRHVRRTEAREPRHSRGEGTWWWMPDGASSVSGFVECSRLARRVKIGAGVVTDPRGLERGRSLLNAAGFVDWFVIITDPRRLPLWPIRSAGALRNVPLLCGHGIDGADPNYSIVASRNEGRAIQLELVTPSPSDAWIEPFRDWLGLPFEEIRTDG